MRLSALLSLVIRIVLSLFLVSGSLSLHTYAQSTPPEEKKTLFDQIEESQKNNIIISGDTSLIKSNTGKQGLLVRITLLILRITVVMGVTMVIISAIRLLFAQGNTDGVQKTTKQIIWVGVGILLALSSFVLIDIVKSTTTTLDTVITEAQQK